ncbi:MAG: alanine racemase [Clostridia bacterium]|nr:alanine racemase [Clostridia bacterium]
MKNMPGRAWVEINLDSIACNLRKIKESLGKRVLINGVIKADGYGHGAVMTARVLCDNGIDMLSVATLDEAVQLRKQKIGVPILVLGYTEVGRLREIVRNDIIVSVFDIDLARRLSDEAKANDRRIKVHIKIDTGMNRIGFPWDFESDIIEAFNLKGLEVCGTFTHFSTADEEDGEYTKIQFDRFMGILEKLGNEGLDPGVCHADNSGGALLHGDKALDMVRTGLLLYGLYPSEYSRLASGLELEPAMTFKAKIIKIRELEEGMPVSYGNRYITTRRTKIATIACGYADGYSRVLSGKAQVLINGKKAPVIGNICMDMCMADISGIDTPVMAGDEAVLFNGDITADDVADISGTINYEIICRIGMRVPRVYIQGDKVVKVSNYLL